MSLVNNPALLTTRNSFDSKQMLIDYPKVLSNPVELGMSFDGIIRPRVDLWMSMFSDTASKVIRLSDDLVDEKGTDRLSVAEYGDQRVFERPPVIELNAWKTSVMNPINDAPPSLHGYLSGGFELQSHHEEEVAKLMRNVKYVDKDDQPLVTEALKVAYIALYGKRTQRSMEDSIERARGIAAVLTELRMPREVVLAGILHDVFAEVTYVSGPGVRVALVRKFGEEVVQLVEQYSRLPKFMHLRAEYTPMQAEHQMQMLVALAEDYRVLFIRLAGRVHNLRNIRSLPITVSERQKIAEEALYVYAPLAHKMGLVEKKGELEDMAFVILRPDLVADFKTLKTAVNCAYHHAEREIKELLHGDPVLAQQKVTFRLDYRVKGRYQTFLKMTRKNLTSLSDVRDCLGFRVIINVPRRAAEEEAEEAYQKRSQGLCFHVVDRLRSMAGWAPERVKDYISQAKPNGYQSIHQYLSNVALKAMIEVQVRTSEMHRAAELGEAAHWFYKDLVYRPDVANSKVYKLAWRSPQQTECNTPKEVLKLAHTHLASQRVFVYLHDQSTVMNLRRGSTALDGAFAVHTDVGLSTKRIFVNGKPAPLNKMLSNGDVISVERAPEGVVTAMTSWALLLKNPHSLSVLKRYLKDNHRDRLVCHGCALLFTTIAQSGLEERLKGKLRGVKLATTVRSRTGLSSLSEWMAHLGGTSSRTEARDVIVRAFDVREEELTVFSVQKSLGWMRGQNEDGWVEHSSLHRVLMRLFREDLKAEGAGQVGQLWSSLVGFPRMPFAHRLPLSEFSIPIKSRTPQPFSLQAPSLPRHVLRQAKESYGQAALRQERLAVSKRNELRIGRPAFHSAPTASAASSRLPSVLGAGHVSGLTSESIVKSFAFPFVRRRQLASVSSAD